MKKTTVYLLASILTIFLFLFSHSFSLAQTDTGWTIDRFHSSITVNSDTSVDVTETIEVDFHDLNKHGIFRDIPVKYKTQTGNNLDTRFELLSVTDESGNPIPARITRERENVNIRIGDPNKYVTGNNIYVISYSVLRVLTSPNQQAELYWNATGNNWPVEIALASAEVRVPDGSLLDTICFTGYYGQSQEKCTHGSKKNEALFTASSIAPGQGLTIAVALDKSFFSFPSQYRQVLWFLTDNWIYFLPLLVLFAMLRLYWKRGRDKQFRNVLSQHGGIEIVPLFSKINALTTFHPPKDLSPGEVGTLYDEKVHSQDITATAIDLARRGYFIIKEITKGRIFKRTDFELMLTGKEENDLKNFEKSVLDMLFGKNRRSTTKLSKMPANAYKYLADAQKNLYQHLADQGYFAGNPKTVRTKYFLAGVAVMVAMAIASQTLLLFIGAVPVLISGFISGLIIIAFSFFMPARTPKGRKALMDVVGLKEYLEVGAWRQQAYEKRNFFEEALPYTIVFGLTSKFIKAFGKANIQKPDWYHGQGAFNAVYFASAMQNFNNSVTSGIVATRPKSASSGGSGFGGGGFSGGGFGGGGGGSW